MDKIKWYSETEYFDIETGEKLNKSLVQREYIIINSSRTTERNEEIGIIKYARGCRKYKQYKLWE